MKRTILLLGCMFVTVSWVRAVDHNNIDAGRPLSFDDAEAVYPRPHHHLVVSGEQPKASPRFYAI